MGVRFLRRGLPVIGPGGAFWMGVHFRRDRSPKEKAILILCSQTTQFQLDYSFQ